MDSWVKGHQKQEGCSLDGARSGLCLFLFSSAEWSFLSKVHRVCDHMLNRKREQRHCPGIWEPCSHLQKDLIYGCQKKSRVP